MDIVDLDDQYAIMHGITTFYPIHSDVFRKEYMRHINYALVVLPKYGREWS